MKSLKLVYLVVAVTLLSISIKAQQPQTDPAALNQQIASLYQAGKFDDAIPLAERVAAIEKAKSPNTETYAMALTNLALLHKERMRRLQRQNESNTMAVRQSVAPKIEKDADKAETNFREALDVYVRRNEGERLAAATVRNELGWLLNNYLAPHRHGQARPRIDEAEKLFTEALAIQEKNTGADSDIVLSSVVNFGNFYMRWNNYEKALPFYERYVATVEKKYGPSARALVPALRGQLEVLVITMQDEEAKALAGRIAGITGRDEQVPNSMPRLGLRARKIEKVKSTRFIPSEFDNDMRGTFSYTVGAGGFSQMGVARFRQIMVKVVVDETGNVIEAKVDGSNVKNPEVAEAAAKASTFRPFVYNGVARKMRGAITYTYIAQ